MESEALRNILLGAFQFYQVATLDQFKEFEKELFSIQFSNPIKITVFCNEDSKFYYYKTQKTKEGYILLTDGEWNYEG